jgi:hypothetical protein
MPSSMDTYAVATACSLGSKAIRFLRLLRRSFAGSARDIHVAVASTHSEWECSFQARRSTVPSPSKTSSSVSSAPAANCCARMLDLQRSRWRRSEGGHRRSGTRSSRKVRVRSSNGPRFDRQVPRRSSMVARSQWCLGRRTRRLVHLSLCRSSTCVERCPCWLQNCRV